MPAAKYAELLRGECKMRFIAFWPEFNMVSPVRRTVSWRPMLNSGCKAIVAGGFRYLQMREISSLHHTVAAAVVHHAQTYDFSMQPSRARQMPFRCLMAGDGGFR